MSLNSASSVGMLDLLQADFIHRGNLIRRAKAFAYRMEKAKKRKGLLNIITQKQTEIHDFGLLQFTVCQRLRFLSDLKSRDDGKPTP